MAPLTISSTPTEQHVRHTQHAPEVSSAELRMAGRTASAGSELRSLLDGAAATIDALEAQRRQLQMSIGDLQAQFPLAPAEDPKVASHAVTDAVTAWLEALDPGELDRLAEPAISRAFVEASVAADRITAEAVARAERLIDHVAVAVGELIGLIHDDAGAATLADWHARFSGQVRAIITQLRLPSTLAVANLIDLLGCVAPGGRPPT